MLCRRGQVDANGSQKKSEVFTVFSSGVEMLTTTSTGGLVVTCPRVRPLITQVSE